MAGAELRLRVGVDAVAIGRVERLVERYPNAAQRIFTDGELDYCRTRARSGQHLAARFCAKEAVLKAFGTGAAAPGRLREVEVLNDPAGRPRVRLTGSAALFAESHRLQEIDLSLAHTGELAIAQVVSTWAGLPPDGAPDA